MQFYAAYASRYNSMADFEADTLEELSDRIIEYYSGSKVAPQIEKLLHFLDDDFIDMNEYSFNQKLAEKWEEAQLNADFTYDVFRVGSK